MTLKIVPITLLSALLFLACQSTNKEQLAQDYYKALNTSDFERIAEIQFDSVRIKEGSFYTAYAVNDYVNWLKWDSVFQPTYKILDVKAEGEAIALTISKVCQRIQFLNEGPMISKERIRFKNGKMYELEIQEIVDFDDKGWNARREELVNWIAEQHPELDGFIFDQSLQGGLNYRKALELFQKATGKSSNTNVDYETEKAAILATLNNETKAAFQSDYDAWQGYWVQDADITKSYLDFPENTFSESLGWEEISGFVKTFFEEHPEPEPVPELLDSITVRLYGNGAWVTYQQQDSIRGLKRETRLMEKVNGQWKIAGMQTTIYGFEE